MWRIELADRDVKAERKVVNAWAKKNKKELEGDKKMQAEYTEMLAKVDDKVLKTNAACPAACCRVASPRHRAHALPTLHIHVPWALHPIAGEASRQVARRDRGGADKGVEKG